MGERKAIPMQSIGGRGLMAGDIVGGYTGVIVAAACIPSLKIKGVRLMRSTGIFGLTAGNAQSDDGTSQVECKCGHGCEYCSASLVIYARSSAPSHGG